MKYTKHFMLLALLLTSLCIFNCNTHDLKITVKDSETEYKFSAHYDKGKTDQIQELINEKIAPTHFNSTEDWDFEAVLDDKTRFKIESAPGDLEILLDKKENNRASYERIKRICEEIKGSIGEK